MNYSTDTFDETYLDIYKSTIVPPVEPLRSCTPLHKIKNGHDLEVSSFLRDQESMMQQERQKLSALRTSYRSTSNHHLTRTSFNARASMTLTVPDGDYITGKLPLKSSKPHTLSSRESATPIIRKRFKENLSVKNKFSEGKITVF